MALSRWANSRWLREPLVHFLLAGTLIFLFFLWKGEPVDPTSRLIAIDREQQAQLALSFERTMRRAPTDAELDNLVERYVRDEVLYREALRLGLDQDDAVVRRRLAQKMDILASSRLEAIVPSDELLEGWLNTHPERFTAQAKYSLDQLWYPTRDGAEAQLARLQQGDDWQDAGEPISLPKTLDGEDRAEILNRFGEQFLGELEALETSEDWQGPIPSGLGWHLIRLRARDLGNVPELADIRTQVENDWRSSTMEQRRDEAYQLLREAYRVDIAQ